MKKIITLIIVFLCINLITTGKNRELGNLNAVPGIPILHNNTEDQSPVAQNMAHDSSKLAMILNVNTDSIQNYLEYLQDYGDPYMLSKGHMSISFWLKQRLAASSGNTLVYDTFGISKNIIHYCGTISVDRQEIRNMNDQKLLVAHQTPVIIYNLCKNSKAHFQNSSFIIPQYYRSFEWKGNFYAKTIAYNIHNNTLFNVNVVISNSKPVCTFKNDCSNSSAEARKPENSTLENQGLEFILPQRI
jgi:hypothetical protein